MRRLRYKFLFIIYLFGRSRQRVAQHQNHRIAAQKHFRYEAILVDRFHLLLALAGAWHLRPHLLDALQHHVAVPVERLDATQQLLVVPAIDQHLRVVLDGLRQHGQWPGVELLLLLAGELLGRQLGFRLDDRPGAIITIGVSKSVFCCCCQRN